MNTTHLSENEKNLLIEKALKDQSRRRQYNKTRWEMIKNDPTLKEKMYTTQKNYRIRKDLKIQNLEKEILRLKNLNSK